MRSFRPRHFAQQKCCDLILARLLCDLERRLALVVYCTDLSATFDEWLDQLSEAIARAIVQCRPSRARPILAAALRIYIRSVIKQKPGHVSPASIQRRKQRSDLQRMV